MDGALIDWMSVEDAAPRLGISAVHVRRLAREGVLPAIRVGGRWLVSASGVAERKRAEPVAGRPISFAMAWAVLNVLDPVARAVVRGDASAPDPDLAAVPDRRVRHRLSRLLAEAPPPLHWHLWLRRRAQVRRVWVHPGVHLADDPRLHWGGAAAAEAAGLALGASPADVFYVSASDVKRVERDYRIRAQADGPATLMIVPGEADVLPGVEEPMPPAVALVDMLLSNDARRRDAASLALTDVIAVARP